MDDTVEKFELSTKDNEWWHREVTLLAYLQNVCMFKMGLMGGKMPDDLVLLEKHMDKLIGVHRGRWKERLTNLLTLLNRSFPTNTLS